MRRLFFGRRPNKIHIYTYIYISVLYSIVHIQYNTGLTTLNIRVRDVKRGEGEGGFLTATLFRLKKKKKKKIPGLILYSTPPTLSHLSAAPFLFSPIGTGRRSLKSFHRVHSTRPEEEEGLVSWGVMLGECSGDKSVYE